MKKTLLLLLLLLTYGLSAQTYLQLKQIQPAAGANSVIVTNSLGAMTYTPNFPISRWTNDVPYLTTSNTASLYLPLSYTNSPTWAGIVTQNSTSATSTINGAFWYGGLGGASNGFNFYHEDPSNLSFLFRFGRANTSLSYYPSSTGDNWLSVPLNTNFVISNDGAITQAYEIDATQKHGWACRTSSVSNSSPSYQWAGANYTNQGAEVSSYNYITSNVQLSTSIALQRSARINQSTITFPSANTVTTGATFYIAGPLISGTNASISQNSALQLGGASGTFAIGAGSINGYGLSCYTPAGGINNYAAQFMGGNVGIGTSSPAATLDVNGTGNFTSQLNLNGFSNSGTAVTAGASTLAAVRITSTLGVSGTTSLTGLTNTGAFSSSGAATVTGGSQLTGTVNVGSGAFSTSTLSQLRVTSGTGTVDIGQYTAGRGAIWLNQNTPSATNWGLSSDGSGNLFVNAPTGAVDITLAGSIKHSFSSLFSYVNSNLKIGANTTAAQSLDVNGGIQLSTHLICIPTSSLTFTVGVGAGSGATATLTNCSDVAGTVSVTTAGVPSASSPVITITFQNTFLTTIPHIQLTPGNAATALLSGVTEVYPTKTLTTMTFNSNTTGITTGTVYTWDYTLIQ